MSHVDRVTDLALARRLERAEASASAAYIESRARQTPSLGAQWIDVSGTYAMFDGVGSPLSQTFGFGLFAPPTADDLATIEAFFTSRDAEIFHEVSPLADPTVLTILGDHGYRPVELTSVMHRPLTSGATAGATARDERPSSISVRCVAPGGEREWAETAARGWSDTPDLAEFVLDFAEVSARSTGTVCCLADLDGQPIAAAAIAIHGGVALLAGASTAPEYRGRGAQAALLGSRLRYAAAHGCDLAMMGAAPGSPSQRNGERQGFRIAYTRIKWQRMR